MKYYAYEDFKKDTNLLLQKVKEFDCGAIIAIARGGMTISHCLAEGLDIRNVQTLRTELYDDTQKRDKIILHNNCDLSSLKRVLVIDDISDSGDTLKAVMDELKTKHKDIEFKTATLFYKKTSTYEPDFWVNEAREWIEFFWEKDFR